jgi:hypothetical protein
MKTVSITQLAKVIRSKNAGPYELTLDIIFNDQACYDLAAKSKVINAENIAKLYRVTTDKIINIVEFPQALAIKATIVRPRPSGALGETDVYGAQQHAPLLQIEIPTK